MLVAGTSALVHPAASLPLLAKQNGAFVFKVNPDVTPLSPYADETLRGPTGEILPDCGDNCRPGKTQKTSA